MRWTAGGAAWPDKNHAERQQDGGFGLKTFGTSFQGIAGTKRSSRGRPEVSN
jgi:5-methylcytosine-specific restriction endonuclease McrBC GTP-binding regulatory subunit McrB